MLSLKLFYNSNFHSLRQTLSFIIPNYGDLAVFAECKQVKSQETEDQDSDLEESHLQLQKVNKSCLGSPDYRGQSNELEKINKKEMKQSKTLKITYFTCLKNRELWLFSL